VAIDDVTGEEHYDGNMYPVYVIPRPFTAEELQTLRSDGFGAWRNRYHYPVLNVYCDIVEYRWDRYFDEAPTVHNCGRYWDTIRAIPFEAINENVRNNIDALYDYGSLDDFEEIIVD
jgi:fermentation-respiration switch protein FrsA (DUF1100 family)